MSRNLVYVTKRLSSLKSSSSSSLCVAASIQSSSPPLARYNNHNIVLHRKFQTRDDSWFTPKQTKEPQKEKPGSIAFVDCETAAITDLFFQFAKRPDIGGVDGDGQNYLTLKGVRELLLNIGERPDDQTLRRMFLKADANNNGTLDLQEFLHAADSILGGAPARVVLVVGGPGSGKGILCDRLSEECGIVHLSSGDLLRDEVKRATPLGKEVAEIMKRGELVSSAIITTLVRRRMRAFPGRRILLDGFPRSLENAHDFLEVCGKPELALHLECDDTILMERIIKRAREGQQSGEQRSDDNFETAIRRLRTFHKYHNPTMDWLREQHVPIVNLDCSMSPANVWNQLMAIGRLMRPAAQIRSEDMNTTAIFSEDDNAIRG